MPRTSSYMVVPSLHTFPQPGGSHARCPGLASITTMKAAPRQDWKFHLHPVYSVEVIPRTWMLPVGMWFSQRVPRNNRVHAGFVFVCCEKVKHIAIQKCVHMHINASQLWVPLLCHPLEETEGSKSPSSFNKFFFCAMIEGQKKQVHMARHVKQDYGKPHNTPLVLIHINTFMHLEKPSSKGSSQKPQVLPSIVASRRW